MITCFAEMEKMLKKTNPVKLCIAGANDPEILLAVKTAEEKGYIIPILTGKKQELEQTAKTVGLKNAVIADTPPNLTDAEYAVQLIKEEKADLLMKGTVNTTDYMRSILNKEKGLRGKGLLMALAVYEVPSYKKLIFGSDSGINVLPSLEQKKNMVAHCISFLKALGYEKPNVAFLAASEVVNPKVPATSDAAELTELCNNGAFGNCYAEGPLALDVIFNPHAAKHKKINSKLSGEVDLLLFPNMEAGNVLGKCWLEFCHAKWAGLVLGAAKPIILGSRSDTAEVKINSIILGCLAVQKFSH